MNFSIYNFHKFGSYINLINSWASRSNLISRHDLPGIVERHILPSVLLFYHIKPKDQDRILDIGSGAGFPGIVFKILQPNLDITLIDSAKKKYLFLLEANESLSLNCKIIHRRVESLKTVIDEKYDVAVSRAVNDLRTLWSWSADILQDDGSLYTIKGETDEQEITRFVEKEKKIEVLKPATDWLTFSKYLEKKIVIKVEK